MPLYFISISVHRLDVTSSMLVEISMCFILNSVPVFIRSSPIFFFFDVLSLRKRRLYISHFDFSSLVVIVNVLCSVVDGFVTLVSIEFVVVGVPSNFNSMFHIMAQNKFLVIF